ncbi:MAG: cysteine hydrolase [Betaproteobacteria bacterium]|nr:cysteine hydrolase [Betaproteobacteria bacterium]
MTKALLIVDIQNDYFPGGAMELEGSVEAGGKAKALLAAFRAKGLPVVHVQHLSVRPGATFFVPGTPGVEIHPAAAPSEGEPVFQKNFPNSFRQTGLLDHLKQNGVTELVIAGMMTHMCIDATTRAAFDLGFKCRLAHDACATRALSFGGETVPARYVHNSFISALHGLFANCQSADEVISRL